MINDEASRLRGIFEKLRDRCKEIDDIDNTKGLTDTKAFLLLDRATHKAIEEALGLREDPER